MALKAAPYETVMISYVDHVWGHYDCNDFQHPGSILIALWDQELWDRVTKRPVIQASQTLPLGYYYPVLHS